MSTQVAEAQIPVRPRPRPRSPEAVALGRQVKAARRRRTNRLRKGVVAIAAAAFLGPFAVIYTQVAAGRDPALVADEKVSSALSPNLAYSSAAAAKSASVRAGALEDAQRLAAERRAAARAAAAATATTTTTTSYTGSATTPTQTVTPTPVTTQQS